MPQREGRRFVAVATVLLLTAGLLAFPRATTTQRLGGKVLGPDGVTPVAGAVVVFKERRDGRTYISEPTEKDGTYRVSGIPDGEYLLTIRTDAGEFEISKSVEIQGGQPTTLTVMITGEPVARNGREEELLKKKHRKLLAIILPCVGGAALIGLAAGGGGGDDEEGSPHKP